MRKYRIIMIADVECDDLRQLAKLLVDICRLIKDETNIDFKGSIKPFKEAQ